MSPTTSSSEAAKPAATTRSAAATSAREKAATSSSATAPATTSQAETVLSSFPARPLTTTFTPPDNCGLPNVYLSYVGMVDLATSCLPSGFEKAATAYFSPGIACPSGYYSACHDTTGVKSITTVTCCPHGENVSLSCVNPAALTAIWSTLFCTWEAPSTGHVFSMTLSSNGVTSTVASTMTFPEGINAYGVRMVFESTDSIGPTSDDTDSNTSSATSSPSSTNPPTGSSSSALSTGAIAAIAVVIPLVLIAAAIGAFFLWRRRKQRYSTVGSAGSPRPGAGADVSYYGEGGGKKPVASPGSELQGNDKRLYAPYRPVVDQHGHALLELPPSTTPVELAADEERRPTSE